MKPSVLFLCTGNSCRSQMAEGWLRHLAGSRFEVASAGTHPAGLNSLAVVVMQEAGVDIARHRSKRIDEFAGRSFDYVITVCDRVKESCPVFPGNASVLHWSFDDPAESAGLEPERIAAFRRVRDEIAGSVKQFLRDGR